MPTFYPDVEDINVDPEEFLSACDTRETEELIDALIEGGYLKKNCRPSYDESYSPSESFYQEALDKLNGKWNMLTKEEEELILKIANRF